jgi:ribose-phosphate pyrophosphokinase
LDPLVISIPSYEDLAASLAALGGWDRCDVERRRFSDGEVYQRLSQEVRGREVVLVAGTPDESDTLMAYDLACAIARYGARRLTWVLPYFGCQTMERSTRPGDVVTAKTRARLISSVPQTALGNRVLLCDLHTPGIPFYFGDGVQAFHLYAKPLVLQAARTFGGEDFVLAAPDAGRAKWVQSLANDLGVEVAFVYKRRFEDGKTQVTGVDARVKGRTVVIYDDMIRTGGTLIKAAQAYLDAGATRCFAVTTHLVLPGDAWKVIQESGVLDGVAGTDTHPRARLFDGEGLIVNSTAGVFYEWIEEEG